MSTIEITDIEHLREGDFVRLRWEHGEGVQVTLEGPMWNRMVGGYTVTDARFVSAAREVPEWEPGTAGTATVRCVEGVRVMRTETPHGAWFSSRSTGGFYHHPDAQVTDFVPDDAETLRAEVERLRAELEGLRDAMDSSTHFLISSGGTIWHHDQNCPNRRTVRTRDQVAEILRARMGGNIEAWHDDADAILALFEQGGAS